MSPEHFPRLPRLLTGSGRPGRQFPRRKAAWHGRAVRQHENFKQAGGLSQSVATALERAGFACRIFSSGNSKDGCMIAEIRPKDAMRRVPHLACNTESNLQPANVKDAGVIKNDKGRLGALPPRELSVLLELTKGNANKAVAYNLGISPRTVEVHRARIMVTLEARSLADLSRLVLRPGTD